MDIIRATQVAVIGYLEEHLIPDTDVPVDVYKEHIRHALINNPQETFILVGYENNKIHGFMIAYAPDNMKYVFVSQAWCDGLAAEAKLSDQFLLRLVRWTDSIGRETIRAETFRDIRGFTRKWGFKPISTTVELKLEDMSQEQVLKLLRKDNNNVEEIRTEVNVDPDRGSEASESDGGGLFESQDRTGIDTVHGSTDSPDEQSVQLDSAATTELATGVDAELEQSVTSTERPSSVAPESRPDTDS